MDEAQTHSIQDAGCLFDSGWYVSRYPECTDSGTRPEDHYQDVGDALGYWPNALFDPAFYSRQYPELPASGGARLIHYFSEGEAAGAKPNICFDPVFYRKNYPDLETLKRPLLFHYLLHGGREGRNPSLLFDGRWYRTVASQLAPDSSNGDLAAFLKWVAASDFGNGDAAVMNPVAHYLHVGEGFGLQPHPLFDPGYYCSQPQTEDLAGKGALAHYLENGDADDGDPHPLFQAQFYMDQFEMDSAPDSNLLTHYLNHGEPKGKLPNPLFDPRHYLEAQSRPQHSQSSALATLRETPEQENCGRRHFSSMPGGTQASTPRPRHNLEGHSRITSPKETSWAITRIRSSTPLSTARSTPNSPMREALAFATS